MNEREIPKNPTEKEKQSGEREWKGERMEKLEKEERSRSLTFS